MRLFLMGYNFYWLDIIKTWQNTCPMFLEQWFQTSPFIYIYPFVTWGKKEVMFVEDTVFMYGNSSSGILQLIPTQPYIPTFVIQWNLSWTVKHWPLDRLVWSVDSQLKRQSRVLVPYYPKEPNWTLDSFKIHSRFEVYVLFIKSSPISRMGGCFWKVHDAGRSTMHRQKPKLTRYFK